MTNSQLWPRKNGIALVEDLPLEVFLSREAVGPEALLSMALQLVPFDDSSPPLLTTLPTLNYAIREG